MTENNLLKNKNLNINRVGRFIIAKLLKPHLVLSTSYVNGGQQDDISYIINHQSSEGTGHIDRSHTVIEMGQQKYHEHICEELKIDQSKTVVMGTAANMQYAAISSKSYKEIEAHAIVTAGVQGNAGRAGDPAKWHETQDTWENVHAAAGTINTALFINWPLTPAALSRAAMIITEAKSAALWELAVPSKYSTGLATGTGTDQFSIASLADKTKIPKTWSGKHTKLGEIIAQAVVEATKEALRWQNGLEPSSTRSIFHALGRFGLNENVFKNEIKKLLEPNEYELLLKNYNAVVYEPQVAGCAYAIAAVLERLEYGTLPPSTAQELVRNQCVLMAGVLAAQPEKLDLFNRLLPHHFENNRMAAVSALALGWQHKWK